MTTKDPNEGLFDDCKSENRVPAENVLGCTSVLVE